jgi:hypothetical protein
MFLGNFFFGASSISTKGMGVLTNQACYKARKIATGLKLINKNGIKVNVPTLINQSNYANVEKSKTNTFDYWIAVSNLWTKKGMIRLPVAGKKKRLIGYMMKGWHKHFIKNHPNWSDRVFIPSPLNYKSVLANIKVRITIEEI